MTVVIGLGSPFRSDDSIGIRVARALQKQQLPSRVKVIECYCGGLSLVEEMEGADKVIIIDALLDRTRKIGEVVLSGVSLASNNICCSHDCSLTEALQLGRELGLKLPDDEHITVAGIVVNEVAVIGDLLSDSLEKSFGLILSEVLINISRCLEK